jgi:hypothetical protein
MYKGDKKMEQKTTYYQVVWHTELYSNGQYFYTLENAEEYRNELKTVGFDKGGLKILGDVRIDKIVETKTKETIID